MPSVLKKKGIMNRERALKVVLVLVGLLFSAVIVPMVIMVRIVLQPHNESALPIAINTANEAMMLSLYATLGVFLLLAARDPSAHRSVIAFAAWSSFAHAAVMAVMSIQVPTARTEWLITAVALGIIGALLIVLAPGKHMAARDAAAYRAIALTAPLSEAAGWLAPLAYRILYDRAAAELQQLPAINADLATDRPNLRSLATGRLRRTFAAQLLARCTL
jgi:hypothetical protein